MTAYDRGRRDEVAGGPSGHQAASLVAADLHHREKVPPISRGHALAIPD